MKAGLKNFLERVLEDDDLGNRITFWRGVLSDERQDNIENLWFIAEKEYLKEIVDSIAYLTGLSTHIDRNGVGQEVMLIKNNFTEVEQFIQDKGEVIREGNEQNQNNSENNDQTGNNDDTHTPDEGEGAIMTDDEYNNLIDIWEQGDSTIIITQYSRLWDQIHEKYEEYKRTKGALMDEISEKAREIIDPASGKPVGGDFWKGRKITAADSEVIKNNLKALAQKWIKDGLNSILMGKKMEIIDLMEEVVKGGVENQTPPSGETPSRSPNLSTFRQKAINTINVTLNLEPKLTNSDLDENCRQWKEQINAANSEKDIDNIKDRVLIDIKVKKKAKKDAENITQNLQTAGKDAEELKKQLEEVEKARGQQSYENNQTAIDNLKNELAKKVSEEEYRQIIIDNTKKTMAKYNISLNELDSEIKKEWERLKNGEIKSQDQVNEVEKKVIKNVGEKGSEKKLNLIFSEARTALKSGNKDQIKKVRNKLNSFVVSTDIYEKSLFSRQEKDIKAMISKLENYSTQNQTSSPDQFPWKVVIPIFLILLVAIGLGIIIYRKRLSKLSSNLGKGKK